MNVFTFFQLLAVYSIKKEKKSHLTGFSSPYLHIIYFALMIFEVEVEPSLITFTMNTPSDIGIETIEPVELTDFNDLPIKSKTVTVETPLTTTLILPPSE